jgi:hypothetical protein
MGNIVLSDSVSTDPKVSNISLTGQGYDNFCIYLEGTYQMFSILANQCSNKILQPSSSCSVTVSFAPLDCRKYNT